MHIKFIELDFNKSKTNQILNNSVWYTKYTFLIFKIRAFAVGVRTRPDFLVEGDGEAVVLAEHYQL